MYYMYVCVSSWICECECECDSELRQSTVGSNSSCIWSWSWAECEAVNPADTRVSRRQLSVQFGAQQAQTIVGKVIQKSCDYRRLGKCNENPKTSKPTNKPKATLSRTEELTNLLASFCHFGVTSFHFASWTPDFSPSIALPYPLLTPSFPRFSVP